VAHGPKRALNVLKSLLIRTASKKLRKSVRLTEGTWQELSLKQSKIQCLVSQDLKIPGLEEMILTNIRSGCGIMGGRSIRIHIETGRKTDHHQRKKRIA